MVKSLRTNKKTETLKIRTFITKRLNFTAFFIDYSSLSVDNSTDVIRSNPKTNKAELSFPEDCQICHLCSLYCPSDAITITPDKSIP